MLRNAAAGRQAVGLGKTSSVEPSARADAKGCCLCLERKYTTGWTALEGRAGSTFGMLGAFRSLKYSGCTNSHPAVCLWIS